MYLKIVLAFAVSFFLLSPLALGQTVLNSGQKTFTVQPILLEQVPDFTGLNKLGLTGDITFLNIRWKAKDPGGIEREIGADCYLNCPNSGKDIDKNCKVVNDVLHKCSYLGPTGDHSCSILNPAFDFRNTNNVTCKFYDTKLPGVGFLPYPNRTFKPIDFEISSGKPTVTVGKSFPLPINIQTKGLLRDRFEVNISALQNEIFVDIENPLTKTEELKYGDIGRVFPTITYLVSVKTPLTILGRASTDPLSCTIDDDCRHLDNGGFKSRCVNKQCWKRADVEIDAGKANLPEYEMFGLFAILILATLIAYKKF